jgi:hypothetical protein
MGFFHNIDVSNENNKIIRVSSRANYPAKLIYMNYVKGGGLHNEKIEL